MLNPSYPKGGKNLSGKQILDLKRTLFHEQLHNLGHTHNESVEFMYACEKCCFEGFWTDMLRNIHLDKDRIECKICRGDYLSNNDPEFFY